MEHEGERRKNSPFRTLKVGKFCRREEEVRTVGFQPARQYFGLSQVTKKWLQNYPETETPFPLPFRLRDLSVTIHNLEQTFLTFACSEGQSKIVKYLLSIPEIDINKVCFLLLYRE